MVACITLRQAFLSLVTSIDKVYSNYTSKTFLSMSTSRHAWWGLHKGNLYRPSKHRSS